VLQSPPKKLFIVQQSKSKRSYQIAKENISKRELNSLLPQGFAF